MNQQLRQAEVMEMGGQIFDTICRYGLPPDQAMSITEQVIFEVNTIYEQCEPVEEIVEKLVANYCR